jgi:hypothetical protein
MSVDLDEIERLAKEATPGPWTSSIETDPETDKPGIIWADAGHHCIGDMYATDDADYIAAVNPSVVLELIAELREYRRREDEIDPYEGMGDDT